ncbi:MAG: hypothetical protein U0841_35320 [Chloroflexia bacterium]
MGRGKGALRERGAGGGARRGRGSAHGVGLLRVPLTGLAIWTFASALGGTGGTAALGVVIPGELRGMSISIMAFCNTLLGLGLGPTLVALATEHAYRDPVAVGLSITSVVLPAGTLAALAFWRAGRMVAREAHA